jgi:hypothetical protein
LGCVAVGADAEGILRIDFEQVRGFVENVGDRLVVHGIKIKQDWVAGPVEGGRGDLSGKQICASRHAVFRTDLRPRRVSMKLPLQALFVTFAACGPFWPSVISNSTVSPSCRLL